MIRMGQESTRSVPRRQCPNPISSGLLINLSTWMGLIDMLFNNIAS